MQLLNIGVILRQTKENDMKLTITIDGNNLDNMFDVCQHLADNLFDGNLEVIDFKDYDGDPVVEVEYDEKEICKWCGKEIDEQGGICPFCGYDEDGFDEDGLDHDGNSFGMYEQADAMRDE